jgi:hypothetical protein
MPEVNFERLSPDQYEEMVAVLLSRIRMPGGVLEEQPARATRESVVAMLLTHPPETRRRT